VNYTNTHSSTSKTNERTVEKCSLLFERKLDYKSQERDIMGNDNYQCKLYWLREVIRDQTIMASRADILVYVH